LVTEVTPSVDATSLSVGIVLSEFNEFVVESLLEGCLEALDEEDVSSGNVTVYRVPGAFEIPGAARRVHEERDHDGIICLGAVIRGETPHFDYICSHVTDGVGHLSMEADVPVIFGVLTTDNRNQALQRARSSGNNKGVEAADSLLRTVGLYRAL
jgi:6,7-dimethyl-8-ribityllumazine synthase